MYVTKNIIDKIINHEGYSKKELFTIRLNKELYTFYINKLVCWVSNQDRQYLSVYHFTSKEQKEKNAWKIIKYETNLTKKNKKQLTFISGSSSLVAFVCKFVHKTSFSKETEWSSFIFLLLVSANNTGPPFENHNEVTARSASPIENIFRT